MQVTARKNEWPLDNLEVIVEVTKKMEPAEIDAPTRDGAFIHGLYAEGARWDVNSNTLEDALVKQLYPPLPIVLVKSAMLSVRARARASERGRTRRVAVTRAVSRRAHAPSLLARSSPLAGQQGVEGHLQVPGLQDAVPRADVCLHGWPAHKSAAGQVGPRRSCARNGRRRVMRRPLERRTNATRLGDYVQ
jgi:hypothetical protein